MGDTVMYFLEGTPNQAGARVTAAYNDDAFGTYCSYIAFTNGPVTKDYTLVIANYSPNFQATVTYNVWRSGTGVTLTAQLTVGGLRHTFSQANTTRHFQTVGLRPDQAGGVVDTVLYVINPTVGATSYFDDDSGLNALSALTATLPCTNCALVAGTYSGAIGGKVQSWAKDQPQIDPDGDGVPSEIESALGTNSNVADTDGDGIPDDVELLGIQTSAGNNGLSDGAIVMPWRGGTSDANVGSHALTKDLFVEVDYMTNSTNPGAHDHNPTVAGNWTSFATDTKSIFLTDSGWTGQSIFPHIEISQSITEQNTITFDSNCTTANANFYTYKNNPAWFDPARASVFHYVIIGHRLLAAVSCLNVGISGESEILGPDTLITLGSSSIQVGTVQQQIGTFMHEVGHSLGLLHNANNNPKTPQGQPGPNSLVHSSVMNYRYQTSAWAVGQPNNRGWGYSNGTCPAVAAGGCTSGGCVPLLQATPKLACGTGGFVPSSNPNCDCDLKEWGTMVNLAFPQVNLFSWNPVCPYPNGCTGEGESLRAVATQAERDTDRGRNEEGVREFFLGDAKKSGLAQREFARKRKEHLASQGMVEGKDFQVDASTGRAYAIE